LTDDSIDCKLIEYISCHIYVLLHIKPTYYIKLTIVITITKSVKYKSIISFLELFNFIAISSSVDAFNSSCIVPLLYFSFAIFIFKFVISYLKMSLAPIVLLLPWSFDLSLVSWQSNLCISDINSFILPSRFSVLFTIEISSSLLHLKKPQSSSTFQN